MEIIQEQKGDLVTLKLKGMLDTLNSGTLGKAVDKLPEDAKQVELDMAEVTYMSSAGLRVILQILELTRRRGGGLRVVRPSPFVREILTTVGFDSLIDIA